MDVPEVKHDDRISIDENGRDATKAAVIQKGGTAVDEREMSRMGKKQELRRNFKFVGIVAFVTILQSTWECTILANWFGLYNGGRAGLVWCTIAVWICFMLTMASMAELASMAPTAGGQYHWVSEFAPAGYQKGLSYIVGWCSCLGWAAGIPSCCIQLAGIIEAMVLLVNPEAGVDVLWKTTLLTFAFVFLTVGFNIFFARHLPLAEGMVLFIHIFGFFAFLITFWIMADHAPPSEVFGTFYNGGGWSSQGLSCLVGLATPLWCFIGPDAGAHMSEELKDASLQLPRAMLIATFFNGVLGVVMMITFCFCVLDVPALVHADSDFPIIEIIYNTTGSYGGTCVLGSLLLVLLYFSTVTTVASTSRQVWAFSRDCGFPFSSWIRQVRPSWEIPLNALLICLGVSLILSAINFGSNAAFNAILSVSNAALVFSYIVSIGCVRLKRLRGEPLLPRRFSLGKYGGIVNDLTLAWLIVAFIFSFFPTAVNDGDATWLADSFNWSIVIFSATLLFATVYYWTGGKKKYVAPVALVKQD